LNQQDIDPALDALVQIALAGLTQPQRVKGVVGGVSGPLLPTPETGRAAVRIAEAAYRERTLAWLRIKQEEPTPGISREVGRGQITDEEALESFEDARPGEEI